MSVRRSALAFALLTALAMAEPAHAGPEARVRVHGTAHLDAMATLTANGTELSGRLVDDAGRAIASAPVRIRWETDTGPRPLPRPHPCGSALPARTTGPSEAGDEALADTDENGRFCLRWALELPNGHLSVAYEDERHLLDASRETVELDRRPLFDLAFAPAPHTLSTDDPETTIVLQARTAAATQREPVPVELFWSRPGRPRVRLAQGDLRVNEALRLSFASKELGAPGAGELIAIASVAGRKLETHAAVTATSRVELDLPRSLRADLSGDVSVDVAAHSASGAIPSGSVEAVIAGRTAGIAPIEHGTAHLLVSLRGAGSDVFVSVRYLSAAPWWVAGPAQEVAVSVPSLTIWRWLPWAVAVFLIGAWLLLAWRRPPRNELPATAVREDDGVRPELAWQSAERNERGWSGSVRDAHDGTPINAARLVVELADGEILEAQSDAEGTFVVPSPHTPPQGLERSMGVLRVEADLHSTFECALPPPGRLTVTLVTRRRALLARFIEWSTRRSATDPVRVEPTPGDVAREAERRADEEVARWAAAVETAAFGPNPVDAAHEAEVRAQEPNPNASDPLRAGDPPA